MPDLEKKMAIPIFWPAQEKTVRKGLIEKQRNTHHRKRRTVRTPFTLTYHPYNLTLKDIILKKKIQTYPETSQIFSLSLLVSFKRDKNIGNFLVGSALKADNQPGTFKCTCSRCKTCPFIHNATKISGPKQSSIKDRFTCRSTNYVYCIIFTLCRKPA